MEKYLMMVDCFEMPVSNCGGGDCICESDGFEFAKMACGASTDFAIHAINSHDELVAMNKELLAALEKVVSDITALSESSYGVHGLHRNGDLAPWSSLFSGGFFEDWLLSVDEAGALIAKAKAAS